MAKKAFKKWNKKPHKVKLYKKPGNFVTAIVKRKCITSQDIFLYGAMGAALCAYSTESSGVTTANGLFGTGVTGLFSNVDFQSMAKAYQYFRLKSIEFQFRKAIVASSVTIATATIAFLPAVCFDIGDTINIPTSLNVWHSPSSLKVQMIEQGSSVGSYKKQWRLPDSILEYNTTGLVPSFGKNTWVSTYVQNQALSSYNELVYYVGCEYGSTIPIVGTFAANTGIPIGILDIVFDLEFGRPIYSQT